MAILKDLKWGSNSNANSEISGELNNVCFFVCFYAILRKKIDPNLYEKYNLETISSPFVFIKN